MTYTLISSDLFCFRMVVLMYMKKKFKVGFERITNSAFAVCQSNTPIYELKIEDMNCVEMLRLAKAGNLYFPPLDKEIPRKYVQNSYEKLENDPAGVWRKRPAFRHASWC